MTGHVVEIGGAGFWSRGYASPAALASGDPDKAMIAPPTTLGSRRHMRFTSSVTRMAISVFEQVVEGSDVDLSKINVFFASSQGEVQIAVELLDKVASEGAASPARFMNSVHNTVTGHLSIATGSHGGFSALAGRDQTVAAALIESYCYLASGEADNVVLIAADEALPAPIDLVAYEGLAMALLLRRRRAAEAGGAIISRIVRDTSVPAYQVPGSLAHLAANPCVAALGVMAAVSAGREGIFRIDGDGGEGWCLELAKGSA